MPKNKLKRYADVERLPNVTEVTEVGMEHPLPEDFWPKVFETNSPRLTLELACGKGEYSLSLAREHTERQFIGLDIKGARIWVGAREALEEGLKNVHFLRVWIDHLTNYFPPQSVEEIWIIFPDPYLREKHEMKRLTSPRFLDFYRRILKPGGVVHLKTDSPQLFEFTLEQIEAGRVKQLERIDNVYEEGVQESSGAPKQLFSVKTFYEGRHLRDGRTIRYLRLGF
jgi:tRNA (guanine-N7-)-methyltransferase